MTAKYAFLKGWKKVPQGAAKELKQKIKDSLGIVSDAAFYSRMRGEVIPLISQFEAIEKIFAMYGITDIWGDE